MSQDAIMRAVYGCRGMGKSTQVKELVKGQDRVIVLDPMGEYAHLPGFSAVAWSEIPAVLQKPKFRISYKPLRGAAPQALHHICAKLLEQQEPYLDWMARGRPGNPPQKQIELVIEEMSLSYPVEKLPADLWGMTEICERGRHAGIDVIGTTQRPASVSTKFRGNVEETFCFHLDLANDVDGVCTFIGREHRDTIRNLQPHEYLHKTLAGVEVKKNKKP